MHQRLSTWSNCGPAPPPTPTRRPVQLLPGSAEGKAACKVGGSAGLQPPGGFPDPGGGHGRTGMVHAKGARPGAGQVKVVRRGYAEAGGQFRLLGKTGEQRYEAGPGGAGPGVDRISVQFHFSDEAEHRLIAGARRPPDALAVRALRPQTRCGASATAPFRWPEVGGRGGHHRGRRQTGILSTSNLPDRLEHGPPPGRRRFGDTASWDGFQCGTQCAPTSGGAEPPPRY